jgi:hypothetical protein
LRTCIQVRGASAALLLIEGCGNTCVGRAAGPP